MCRGCTDQVAEWDGIHSRLGACLDAQKVLTTRLVLQKEVPLGNPDVLVCSVGTEIFFEATGASPEANQQWKTELDQGWDRQAAIDAAGALHDLKPQVWHAVALVATLRVQESTSHFTSFGPLHFSGPAQSAQPPAAEYRLHLSPASPLLGWGSVAFQKVAVLRCLSARTLSSWLLSAPLSLPLCRMQASSARTS